MNLFRKTLTKTELIVELKQVNKDRLQLVEDYKKKLIEEEDYNINYFDLYDKLNNPHKHYNLK